MFLFGKPQCGFPKSRQTLAKLHVNSSPASCIHLASNISDIKKKTFHGQKLVDGWLMVRIEASSFGKERSEILKWKMQQLRDVEQDLRNLQSWQKLMTHEELSLMLVFMPPPPLQC